MRAQASACWATLSGLAIPPLAFAISWIVPSVLNFSQAYLLHLDFVWVDLRLVGLHSSSRTSLWAIYGSNFETSNFNNLYLDLIFGLLLTLRASRSPRPHALGQSSVDHGWTNIKVEPGHLIPSSLYAVHYKKIFFYDEFIYDGLYFHHK